MAGRAQYNMVHNIVQAGKANTRMITTLQNKPKIDTLKYMIHFYT